ncbi:hypothetical protein RND81_03G169100 [Saponaria officinalis]|uniref:Uncharacterized protein n=1 Tax=Saponaria officinalis TaxID=3572 RepID=A0AAW1M9Q0_SAPOF
MSKVKKTLLGMLAFFCVFYLRELAVILLFFFHCIIHYCMQHPHVLHLKLYARNFCLLSLRQILLVNYILCLIYLLCYGVCFSPLFLCFFVQIYTEYFNL